MAKGAAQGTAVPQPPCGECEAASSADDSGLSNCSRCKQQVYCSKDCQTQDWPYHKVACNFIRRSRPFTIQTNQRLPAQSPADVAHNKWPAVRLKVIAAPELADGVRYDLAGCLLIDGLFGLARMPELPLTRKLGFSLRIYHLPGGNHLLHNNAAEILGLIPFPRSKDFGQPVLTPRPTGDVVLAHTQGKHVKVVQVEAVLAYVRQELQEVASFKERRDKGEEVDGHEIAARLLTPEAFAEWFDKEKRRRVDGGDSAWTDLDCPFDGTSEHSAGS